MQSLIGTTAQRGSLAALHNWRWCMSVSTGSYVRQLDGPKTEGTVSWCSWTELSVPHHHRWKGRFASSFISFFSLSPLTSNNMFSLLFVVEWISLWSNIVRCAYLADIWCISARLVSVFLVSWIVLVCDHHHHSLVRVSRTSSTGVSFNSAQTAFETMPWLYK